MVKSPSQRLSIDFEKIIGRGENPNGFTAQTPNGTARWRGTGWNKLNPTNWPQVDSDPVRPAGRSNRTGE